MSYVQAEFTPQQFRRKPDTVWAMRIPALGDEPGHVAIEAWMVSCELVMFDRHPDGGYDIAIAGNWMRGYPGDWIVLTSEHYLVPIGHSVFLTAYEPVPSASLS